MSLTHSNFQEFRYNQKGEYHNNTSNPTHPFNRKPIKRQTNLTKLCPACYIVRSATNKCECNS